MLFLFHKEKSFWTFMRNPPIDGRRFYPVRSGLESSINACCYSLFSLIAITVELHGRSRSLLRKIDLVEKMHRNLPRLKEMATQGILRNQIVTTAPPPS